MRRYRVPRWCSWLEQALAVPTDECIDWPFRLDRDGYGRGTLDGVERSGHHLALLHVGRPLPDYGRGEQTRHLCNRRACVNPRHLLVGSATENVQDSIAHGTICRGERSPLARLTEDQVREIRSSTEPEAILMARYGVSQGAISAVRRRKSWAWLQ